MAKLSYHLSLPTDPAPQYLETNPLISLLGFETFCLSPQDARSDASSSPCSVLGMDDFGIDVSSLDVSQCNFQRELTRLDMVHSALDWLDNIDSEQVPGRTSALDQQYLQYSVMAYRNASADDMRTAAFFPTKEQQECYYESEAEISFISGRHFPPRERSHRKQTVFYCGSEIPQKENPEVVITGTEMWSKNESRGEVDVVPTTRSQFLSKEHLHYEANTLHCGNQFPPKEKPFHAPEVVPTGSKFPTKNIPRDLDAGPTGSQCSYPKPHAQQNSKCGGRSSIPDECKDARYWRKRSRNNISAKKSRAAKRVKDMYIADKIEQLEKENSVLKVMLANVMTQLQQQQKQQHQKPNAFQFK